MDQIFATAAINNSNMNSSIFSDWSGSTVVLDGNTTILSMDSVLNTSSTSTSSSSNSQSHLCEDVIKPKEEEVSTSDKVEPVCLPDVASEITSKTKMAENFDLINDRVLNAIVPDSSSSDTINAKPIGFSSIPKPADHELSKYLDELELDDEDEEEDNSVEEVSSLPVVSTDEDLSSSQATDETTSTSTTSNEMNHEHNIKIHETNSEFENLISADSTTNSKRNSNSNSDDIDQSLNEQINDNVNNNINEHFYKNEETPVKYIENIHQSNTTNLNIHQSNTTNLNTVQNITTDLNTYQNITTGLETHQNNTTDLNTHQNITTDLNTHQNITTGLETHQNITTNLERTETSNTNNDITESRYENEENIVTEENLVRENKENTAITYHDITPVDTIITETSNEPIIDVTTFIKNEQNFYNSSNDVYQNDAISHVEHDEQVYKNETVNQIIENENNIYSEVEISEDVKTNKNIEDEFNTNIINETKEINTNYVINITQPSITTLDKPLDICKNNLQSDISSIPCDDKTDNASRSISEFGTKSNENIDNIPNVSNPVENTSNNDSNTYSKDILKNNMNNVNIETNHSDKINKDTIIEKLATNEIKNSDIETNTIIDERSNVIEDRIVNDLSKNYKNDHNKTKVNKTNVVGELEIERVKVKPKKEKSTNIIHVNKAPSIETLSETVASSSMNEPNNETECKPVEIITESKPVETFKPMSSPDCYVEEKSIATPHSDSSTASHSRHISHIANNQGNHTYINDSNTIPEIEQPISSEEPVIHVEAPTRDNSIDVSSDSSPRPVRPNSLDLPSSPSASLSPSETPQNLSDSEQLSSDNQNYQPPANPTTRDDCLGKEAPFWVPDTEAPNCMHCQLKFTLVKRRHHCRACGQVLCSKCCNLRAPLEYLNFSQERVCLICHDLIAKQQQNNPTTSGDTQLRRPNPNNPMEYCSTIPPLQQVASSANQTPPSVMVPVSVLKREGSLKSKDSTKQVMFSDGIKPGGDLTELDTEREISKLPVRKNRTTKRVGTPPGNLFLHKRALHPDTNSFIPKDGLPPIIVRNEADVSYSELQVPIHTNDHPVKFAIHRNLFAHIKKVHLDCCLGKKRIVWSITSEGLTCVGQDEVVFMIECHSEENYPPQHIFHVLLNIYNEASRGSTVTEMCFVPSPVKDLFGNKDHGGFIFIRRAFQCISHLVLPEPPYLFGVLVHRWEIPWAKLFPLRLILRMGAELKCYPSPLLSVRDREPLFIDVGHTIINLLADFRSYSYTLPSVRGLVIHMETTKTKIIMPKNHYDQVIKAINHSNDSYLAFAGNFSSKADAHLVCVQSVDDENLYSTQTIYRKDKKTYITGLSFIVFNASLKSSDGMTGKTSINEDGLMINILPEVMTKLRAALHDMKDFIIECGPNAEELIELVWGENDLNFNIGARSCIDNKPFDGIQSIRVHGGTDYTGGNGKLIRWTEVFIIETSDINIKTTEDPIDNMKKLSENIARSTCIALISLIDSLTTSNITKFAVRVTIHPDDVGYEAGTGGEKFSPIYMRNLDEGLVPIIHQAAVNSNSPLILELVFRIMEQG